MITRFAPSPTGLLHIGNVKTALVAWLFARSTGGKFILRIDDTDIKRSEEHFVDGIKEDLEWLGLYWDETFRQSDRTERYTEYTKELIQKGILYPCYETQEELEIKKKIALNAGKPPIYDRAALRLNPQSIAAQKERGARPHFRFKLKDGAISWHDLVRGDITFEAENLSDPVWIREDGSMTYSIASVIDDVDYKVTHIIRGEDHITNSAMHIRLFEELAAPIPKFAHLALLKSKEGKFSKRLGGFDIKSLREQGLEPLAILSLLAKLGTSDQIELCHNHQELIDSFDITKFGRAPVFYDEEDILRLNKKLIHSMDYKDARNRINGTCDKNFWESVKHNLSNIQDIEVWNKICNKPLEPVITDLDYTKIAASLLPEGEINENTWNEWVAKIRATTGRSGKLLFMPLRLALTGMDHGPELHHILIFLTREKIIGRLNGITK